jgi:hypothetical protein
MWHYRIMRDSLPQGCIHLLSETPHGSKWSSPLWMESQLGEGKRRIQLIRNKIKFPRAGSLRKRVLARIG